MERLYQLLKELRTKQGLSLRDAAKRAGISHTYLNLLERGTDPRTGKLIKPSVEILKRLAGAYDYSYEKLLEAAGYIEAGRTTPVVYVPLSELKEGMGQTAREEEGQYLPLPRNLAGESCFALRVVGNELADLGICDGDYVIIDPNRKIRSGSLALVKAGRHLYLRKIEKTGSGFRVIPPLPHTEFFPEIVGAVITFIKQNP